MRKNVINFVSSSDSNFSQNTTKNVKAGKMPARRVSSRLIRAGLVASAMVVSGCADQDKLTHMGVGIAASVIVTEITDEPMLGCAAAIILGIAKERYDGMGHGTVDRNDVFATMAGSGCAIAFVF